MSETLSGTLYNVVGSQNLVIFTKKSGCIYCYLISKLYEFCVAVQSDGTLCVIRLYESAGGERL